MYLADNLVGGNIVRMKDHDPNRISEELEENE
jgi:hypothetical protein